MKDLVIKEFKMAMHPTVLIFLTLSAMLMIPNYPYYITFFYTGVGIFFTCLSGRENHDIFYSMTLPIQKRDIVKGRFAFVIIIELLQVIVAIPFSMLRQVLNMPGNLVGMDANIAFFGFSFILLGLFNLTFLVNYYKEANKVGKTFVLSNVVVFVYIVVVEACAHVVPFMKNNLDTEDPQYLGSKLMVLVIGIIVYIVLTAVAYKKSVVSFEAMDL